MCLPGLFTDRMKWAFVPFLGVGYAILIVAALKNGSLRPVTALKVLIASNASFWISYGLWQARLKFVGSSPKSGIEAFAGPVALWLVLLLTFFVYEAVVFLKGLASSQERTTAAIGLVAAIVQVPMTISVAYKLLQGV